MALGRLDEGDNGPSSSVHGLHRALATQGGMTNLISVFALERAQGTMQAKQSLDMIREPLRGLVSIRVVGRRARVIGCLG